MLSLQMYYLNIGYDMIGRIDLQSKSGYFDTGIFCPIAFFCRQVSVKIVLFVIENNRIYLSIGLFCRFGSAIKWTK